MPSTYFEKTLGPQTKEPTKVSPSVAPLDSRMRAALRLHRYLMVSHWNDHALTGADVGLRCNSRIGRFIKGYLPFVRWRDDYCYVQDLDGGKQPICSEDASVVTVFNGEIYNFQSLREQLQSRSHSFRTVSDTEVIVHLYEDFAEKCVQHLRGMFAWTACKHMASE
jgi:Glutamine amidotransferase domain